MNDSPSSASRSRRQFLGDAAACAFLSGALLPAAGALLAAPAARAQAASSQSDPANKIRIGIVGGGFGASFHWHLDPGCIVHAVSDLRPDRREILKQTYQCDLAYDSLEELILDPRIDAVAIFTGAPDHARHTIAAMEQGKHVICAVPACLTLEEAEALLDARRRTGRRYMMAETSYYNPHGIAMRELYRADAFGDIFFSSVEYYHPMSDEERRQHWFYDNQRTWRHGFAPMLYPTHATSYLVATTGERLTEVSCRGFLAPAIEGYGVGQNAYDNPFNGQVALFTTDRGHVCRCNVIWTGSIPTAERAELLGTKLSYFMPIDALDQPARELAAGGARGVALPDYSQRLPEPMRVSSGHANSHPFITHEFIAALLEDREPEIDLHRSLAMTVPGIVANASSRRNGERMTIPDYGGGSV
ncbi:MAG TPA: Gfo/Idh/MocA family oxidoreductase [Candidatus Sumerlaeota bacterium]|nr:Gfo/Idh/MocA family oxidoreductase [Candidatus Sumerlaeota bacterium]